MALLPILTAPDPRLKKKSKPVEAVDDDVRRLMDDMLETMYAAPGIGLAAPQVGELKRVIVLDIDREEVKTGPLFMANPEIIEASDEDVTYEEGCLSVPDHYSDVARPAKVTVRYLDRDGKQQDMAVRGPAGDLRAARDRPSRRHPVHRPHLRAQAQHDPAQAPESPEGEGARRGRGQAGQGQGEGRRARPLRRGMEFAASGGFSPGRLRR